MRKVSVVVASVVLLPIFVLVVGRAVDADPRVSQSALNVIARRASQPIAGTVHVEQYMSDGTLLSSDLDLAYTSPNEWTQVVLTKADAGHPLAAGTALANSVETVSSGRHRLVARGVYDLTGLDQSSLVEAFPDFMKLSSAEQNAIFDDLVAQGKATRGDRVVFDEPAPAGLAANRILGLGTDTTKGAAPDSLSVGADGSFAASRHVPLSCALYRQPCDGSTTAVESYRYAPTGLPISVEVRTGGVLVERVTLTQR